MFCKITSLELQNRVFLAAGLRKSPLRSVSVLVHHSSPPGLCSSSSTPGCQALRENWESCRRHAPSWGRTFRARPSFWTLPPSHQLAQQETRPRQGPNYKNQVSELETPATRSSGELYWCTVSCFPLEKLVALGLTCGSLNHQEPVSGGERRSPLARDSWVTGALSVGRVQGRIPSLSCGNWDITFPLGASSNSLCLVDFLD